MSFVRFNTLVGKKGKVFSASARGSRLLLTHVLVFVILVGCDNHRQKESLAAEQIESFDISPDDQKLLVLSKRKGGTIMFEVNKDGQSPRVTLKPSGDEVFSNPRYSPDGKKIVFIKLSKKNFWESTVCTINRDGTGFQELTHGGELVTEAIFSGSDVLYASTKQYNTSKKKHTTDERKFDIHLIGKDPMHSTKLSQYEVLGIDHLSDVHEKFILFHMNAGKKGGIWSFEKDNPTKALRIFPANGTWDLNQLDKPVYAPDKFIVFTAHAELYAMNLTTQKADLIYNAKAGHSIELLRAFHTQSRVLFKKFEEQSLTSITIDGSEESVIDIEFPSDVK